MMVMLPCMIALKKHSCKDSLISKKGKKQQVSQLVCFTY